MRQFTAEQIQEQFEKLPQSVQEAVSSPEVHENLIEISKKHDLHIDQEGQLVDQVGLVMLGLSPSKDFVSNFSKAANIDQKTASEIATDINSQIFSRIKSSMREFEEKSTTEQNQKVVSDLEKAGDFSIEPSPESTTEKPEQVESHAEVLKGIEEPETFMVDHLLKAPSVTVEEKTVQNVPVMPKEQPKKPSGPDPYREAIE